MSDERADLLAASVLSKICSGFRSDLVYGNKNPGSQPNPQLKSFFDGITTFPNKVMDDYVMQIFTETIRFVPDPFASDLETVYQTCMKFRSNMMADIIHQATPSGISKFRKSLESNDLSIFELFVKLTNGGKNLHDLVRFCDSRLNFNESQAGRDVYGISVSFNQLLKFEKDYGMFFTGDDRDNDVLISYSLPDMSKSISSAISFQLDVLDSIHCEDLNCSYKDATLLTSVTLTKNGLDLLSIPLTFVGDDRNLKLELYDVEARTKVNANGGSSYFLDFDGLEIVNSSPQDFKILSRSMTRRAALKLNGSALESDLGM